MSHSRSDRDFWMYDTSGVLRPAGVEALRKTVDGLASRQAIEDWLVTARKEWVSPL